MDLQNKRLPQREGGTLRYNAPIVQGIERRIPNPQIEVRILLGVLFSEHKERGVE